MNQEIRVLHTDEIEKLWFGLPTGHQHHRLAIQTRDGQVLVFPEAVVAAMVRAYTFVKTHPTRRAVELETREVQNRKKNFARQQLLETGRAEQDIRVLLAAFVDNTSPNASRNEST